MFLRGTMLSFNRLLLLAVCYCGILTSSQLTFVKLEKERLQFASGGNVCDWFFKTELQGFDSSG